MAGKKAVSDPEQKRKLGCISIGLSITGIIGSVITLITVVAIVSNPCRYRRYQDRCYKYRIYVGTSSGVSCDEGVKSPEGYCYSDTCPYNYEQSGGCYRYRMFVGQTGSCMEIGTRGAVGSDGFCYSNYCPTFVYSDVCYNYKTYVGRLGECVLGTRSPDAYCYRNTCFRREHVFSGSCYKHRQYVGATGACIEGVGKKSPVGFCYYICPEYDYDGSCFKYREYVGRWGKCSGFTRDNFCYYNTCSGHTYRDTCYKYRHFVGISGNCTGVMSSAGYCYSNN